MNYTFSQELTAIAAVASLLLNCIVALVTLTWGLKKVGDRINEKIEVHREKLESDIEEARKMSGELAAALRGKIQEIELYIRDTYVRRDSFSEVMKNYGIEMRGQFDMVNNRLERMEKKIDHQT